MNTQDVKMIRILSTIPLNSVEAKSKMPTAMGSGCFVNYKGTLIFLTVLHTVEVKENVKHCIVVDYDLGKGGIHLFPIDDFSVCAMGSLLTEKIDLLDFAMKKFEIPMPPYKFLINKDIEGEFERIDRIPLISDFSGLLTNQEEYGFCGLIQGEMIPLNMMRESKEVKISTGLYSNLAYYDNVRYLETNENCHVFVLENKGYSHEKFQGTSGAPIIDSKGNLVSLVMSGKQSPTNSSEWLIYGVNLSQLSTIVDINCDLI